MAFQYVCDSCGARLDLKTAPFAKHYVVLDQVADGESADDLLPPRHFCDLDCIRQWVDEELYT
jgi:hypothetical protein